MKFYGQLISIAMAGILAAAEPFFEIPNSRPEQFRLSGGADTWFRIIGNKIVLNLGTGPGPSLTITPPPGRHFDLSAGSVLAVDVKNLNDNPAQLLLQVFQQEQASAAVYEAAGGVAMEPGEQTTLRLRFFRVGNRGIDWAPRGIRVLFDGFDHPVQHLEPQKVDGMRFRLFLNEQEQRYELSNFRVEDPPRPLPEALKSKETFYPFIDQFGQYQHGEWPRKVHHDEELRQYDAMEQQDLAAHPGPGNRTIYGGWADGPDYPATGHFYPVKHEGKWFLVDPTGKLFWSYGMNCIYLEGGSDLTLRETSFDLPPGGDILEPEFRPYSIYPHPQFPGSWLHQQGVKRSLVFNFLQSNLLRKYGSAENVADTFLDRSMQRLKSWGLNTIGNWPHPRLVPSKKFPYTISVNTSVRRVGATAPEGADFYEVFDPQFEATLAAAMRRHPDMLEDPWCIGFFVDNELDWGDWNQGDRIALGVLSAAADQPSKREFSHVLQEKYHTIEALNRQWGTQYASWDQFLESRRLPDRAQAKEDLLMLSCHIAERYFSKVQETFRQVAPHKLYLGCRFTIWYNESIAAVAAKYVDVLSFNLYKYSIGTFRPPLGTDKPILVGEWHFGTMQYGPPWGGVLNTNTADQQERARAFDRYMRSALWNPSIVGAHYFSMFDECAAGRPVDGENIQFGFVSIADVSYPEIVAKSRTIAETLYQIRTGHPSDPAVND